MKRNIINFSLFFVLSLAFMSISAMAQTVNSTTTDRIALSDTPTNYYSETMSLTQEEIDNDRFTALLLLATLGLLTMRAPRIIVTRFMLKASYNPLLIKSGKGFQS
jgi:hypothetical protein